MPEAPTVVNPVVITGQDQSGPAFDSYRDNVVKAREETNKFASTSVDAAKKTESAFKLITPAALGVTAAVTAVAGAAYAAFKTVKEQLLEVGALADKHRFTPQFAAGLEIEAARSGVSVEKLNSALDKFTEVSKQSEDEAKDLYKALRAIGDIFASDFKNAKSQEERWNVIGNALEETTDEVKRAKLALAAFGTDSEAVMRMTGMRVAEVTDQARALGVEIDSAMVKKAQSSSREMGALATVLKLQLTAAIGDLMPVVREAIPYLERMAAAGRDVLASFASAENRPAATLRNNIATLDGALATWQKRLDELRAERPFTWADMIADPGSTFFRRTEAEIAADIKKTEGFMKKFRAEKARDEAILAGRPIDETFAAKKPEDAAPPAYKPRPKDEDDKAKRDAFDRQVDAISRHVAVMEADARAVDKTAGAHQQLRTEAQFLEAARRAELGVTDKQIDAYNRLRTEMSAQQALAAAGIKLSDENAAAFLRLSERARGAADALAAMRLESALDV